MTNFLCAECFGKCARCGQPAKLASHKGNYRTLCAPCQGTANKRDACITCGEPRGESSHPSYCRLCYNALQRISAKKLKEANPERIRRRNRAQVLRKHHITQESWDKLLAEQGGVCAVCKTDAPRGRGECFNIDHDHTCCPGPFSCGSCIRGLLCVSCNTAIGHAGDDPARLRAMAGYLEMALGYG